MRMVGRVAALVVLWLLAWGEVTIANLASGIVVAGALFVVFPPDPPTGIRIRPIGVVRLFGYIALQLITSNFAMARHVLQRRPSYQPGVLAHRLQQPSEEVVTVMTSVIALSPGTMTVDTVADSSTIYVHFLVLDDVAAARHDLEQLEHFVAGAMARTPDQPGRPTSDQEPV